MTNERSMTRAVGRNPTVGGRDWVVGDVHGCFGPLAVAMRKSREESGLDVRALDNARLDIDVHRIPVRAREPAHVHFDVRFLVRAEHDQFRVSDESHALAWVPAVGLGALTDEDSVLPMAQVGGATRQRQEVAKCCRDRQ